MGKPIILAENILEEASTLVATNTATDYDVAHLVDRRPYTFWKASAAGTLYLTANLGEAVAADALGLVGHNFGTAEAAVTLQHSANGTDWTTVVTEFEPATDRAIMKTFTSVSKQYWRLKIVTASVAPYLAVMFIGARLDFPRYVLGEFDPGPERLYVTSATSKAGYPLGATLRYVGHDISVSFQNLTDTWVRNTFKPVWDEHLSQLKPFFWAWNLADYAADVYYVQVPDNFSLTTPYNPVRRNLSLEFKGSKE